MGLFLKIFTFWLYYQVCRFSSQPKIELTPVALEAQSLNHQGSLVGWSIEELQGSDSFTHQLREGMREASCGAFEHCHPLCFRQKAQMLT